MPLSFQARTKFKTQPEERIDEFDFIGGLVVDVHETKLKNNQSPDMANVVFTDSHSVKTRNGYTRYNGNPIGISADQSETGASAGTVDLDATGDYVAQTFIPSGTIACVQVNAYLAMNTTGQTQYVRAELWSTSAGAPSQPLTNGKSQIKLISGTGETAYNFRFRTPVTLTTGTTYALVIKPVVVANLAIKQVNVHRRGDTYASGSVYTSTDAGLSWTNQPTQDLKFVVYSGGDTASSGLIRYYNTAGDKLLLSKFGSTIYYGDDITGALTAYTMPSGINTATSNIDYTTSNDTLLIVDGTNYIKKFRGSTNANYSTGTITVTNGSATIVGSGTSWNTATNAEVGEYIKLPDGKWYKITAIGNDTSLTIECAYEAGGASGQSYIISPWGEVQGALSTATGASSLVRPTPTFIENHINRVWVADGNSLYFSTLDTSIDEENFNDFDTANNAGQINVPSGEGDTITGLYSLNNSLYVFQRRAIWRIYGTGPSNFELRNVTNEIGLIDRSTLVEWDNVLLFLSDNGIYMFDGSNLRNLSADTVDTNINNWANKTSPRAVLWNNNYLISYRTTDSTYNNEALFYDLNNGVWGKIEDLYATNWVNWNGGTDNGEVYFGSSNQGSIYRWDIGGNDDGYEIATRYSTPSIGYGMSVNDKTAKKFYLQQIALGDWDMTVTQTVDITGAETSSDINLSAGATSLWDVAQWDVDLWSAEGTLITTRVAEFQGIAKYFKYTMEQEGYDEGIEVLGMTVTGRPRRLN